MTKLCDKNNCIGCGACANVCPKNCIALSADDEGFMYPTVNISLCVDCGLCNAACPVIGFKPVGVFETPVVVASYNRELDIVNKSSSGGVFTALATFIISQGGVVYGAAYNKDFCVEHIRVDRFKDVYLFQGSKYLQSNMGTAYIKAKADLKAGLKVLFSGTPCQIAALKQYLGKPYKDLICVDIICHSVPSPKVWEEYLAQIERNHKAKVVSVNFRDKRDSWRRYCLCIALSNGEEVLRTMDSNLYMKAFIEGLSTRESCYSCKFKGQNRGSDITIGDFWGCESVCPEFAYTKGTSLVLLQSEKGRSVFSAISDKLRVASVETEAALSKNPAYYQPAKPHARRAEFFERFNSEDFEELVKALTASEPKTIANGKWHKNLFYRGLRKIGRIICRK